MTPRRSQRGRSADGRWCPHRGTVIRVLRQAAAWKDEDWARRARVDVRGPYRALWRQDRSLSAGRWSDSDPQRARGGHPSMKVGPRSRAAFLELVAVRVASRVVAVTDRADRRGLSGFLRGRPAERRGL